MPRRLVIAALAAVVVVAVPHHADAAALDGAALRWPWALPFAGILLTIALGPLLFARFWHAHDGKIAAAWAALTLAAIGVLIGPPAALAAFVHAMLGEYLSFIVLLFALYTVAGGIHVTGRLAANPLTNIGLLALGTVMASLVGTTGAAMILIRPLIRANDERRFNAHVVVFFIILVANIGGALTPLGDPPLFVGYLRGVEFFWTARHIGLETALVAAAVLAIFLVLDGVLFALERRHKRKPPLPPTPIRVRGAFNLVLVALIVGVILLSAAWQPGTSFTIGGTELKLQNLARDAALLAIAGFSVLVTREEHRLSNGFSWEPIKEVARLFAGIFVCVIPVLAMLEAGDKGAFAWLLASVTHADGSPNPVAYFWLTGLLSAFLDNAPTYLVVFELAGGDAARLMGPLAATLAAISMGAVYMGALTYIGNAPNLMVQAIAVERGIRMPGFFGYMLWAAAVLLPILALLTCLRIR
jgi:Na+/H+ antiporter NhaD/arsenite permease-like protein